VEPDDLCARKQAEFIEVIWSPVHFGDVPDVRLLVIKRLRQAYVEIGREDRSGQSAQNQLGSGAVACADVLAQGGQVEKATSCGKRRLQEMFDDEREVLGKTVIAVNEPFLRMKPRRPLRCLDLFGERFAAELKIRVSLLCEPLDALGRNRNSRRKRCAGAEEKTLAASLSGCKSEQRRATCPCAAWHDAKPIPWNRTSTNA